MRIKIQDSTHTIAANARRFFSGTALSRATGLAREVAMAVAFGTKPAIAAFWMAFRFAHLLRRLFGEGALNAAFIPHYEMLKSKNKSLSARFFCDLSIGVGLLLLGVTLLAEGVLGGVLLFSHIGAESREVIQLTMWMLPSLIFISLYAMNSALLNCEHSFFLPSVAPTILNIIWIFAVLLLWQQPVERAVKYLAMTLVVAFIFQWGVTVPKVFSTVSRTLTGHSKENKLRYRELLKILRPFALGMVGVAATQLNTAVDALFARAADPQGPAYLWYAIRIQQLPLALLGVGLTGALLPPISRAIQKGELGNYLHFLNFALKRIVLWMLPVMGAIFALGFSGINLVYGHGEFSHQAVLETTLCLWAYGVALLPMTLVLILASSCYAHHNYRIPALISILAVALNVMLNAFFVYRCHLGTISVALSTGLCACVNTLLLGYYLKRNYGLDIGGLLTILLKGGVATLIATTAAMLLGYALFQENTFLWLTNQTMTPFPREIIMQFTVFFVETLTFGTTFLLSALLLRLESIFDLLTYVRSKVLTR